MSTIKLARIFTDNAVLQRNKPVHVWGFADSGSKITAEFDREKVTVTADDNGRFDAVFSARDKGGPYTLTARNEKGEEAVSRGIMMGDVIIISGQSNMEFPMIRVKETYPREWDDPADPLIRTFKVTENGVFTEPLTDVETGEWKMLSDETIDDYSAVGYFIAKHLRLKDDAAVGLVDLTLGGVIIEAFMSPEMLEGFDGALAEAERFRDDAYRLKVLEDNEKNAAEWMADLDRGDIGVKGHYEDGEEILAKGCEIVLPDFFSDTSLAGLTGTVWIAKRFSVPKEYVGRAAHLWFGDIVDFDWCYINGTFVGNTEYCYPPRRYAIPEGLLRSENTVVFRIGVEKGYGRVTPGKLYAVVFGEGVRTTDGFYEGIDGAELIVPLSGVWKYLIGCRSRRAEDTVFVNWKPTALYNGMMAPLSGLGVEAFAFYQGESNCQNHSEYPALTERFASQVRRMWGDIPYICVQLPEFNARMEEISYDHGEAWRGLMAAQEKCNKIPGFYLVRSYGYGELNDLHPQRKEPIGEQIADVIRRCRNEQDT